MRLAHHPLAQLSADAANAAIPAWAKLLAISVAALAVIALLVAAPWRSAHGPCVALLENIDLVQRGAERRRVSSTFVFRQSDLGAVTVSSDEGDFSGSLTLDGVRACLGSDWTETHAAAQAEAYGDAWVFSRPGAPLVLYVQGRNDQYRHVETKIVIERAE